ncbi:hypothetical protein SAMN05443429_1232 [Cruoricaptor ignavus]|uniref:Uncharacterized protein n=1 Tax=Cruoricaptor ignavus TaxID=1118202 RepID=A0A1M6HWY8_9FLAO|nr:hypothetical protein [Cruoricaptor ignavus]QOR72985.1 hypothetical protein IMZ16_05395 [Cruoricaptor ignavus]SHJ26756.1 hypothetical protein SAMN05443429_1232 [Cruoricaptor ignavus]
MKKRIKDNELKEKKSDFFEVFEEWHDRKYSDEYRYRNKLPFYFNQKNYLKIGFLSLVIPLLCLIISIIIDLGIGFYIFFLLTCFPGMRLIIKYYNSKQ